MAIVNPSGGRVGGLLKQIVAEREETRARQIPSAQPKAPLRQLVQQPTLQPEAPGSARVAAVKPLLNEQAATVVPPTPTAGAGEANGGGVAPGTVVPPAPDRPTVQTPAAPSPGAPAPAAAPAAAAAVPAPAPPAPVTRGRPQVLGVSTRRPGRSRITPRRIVDLPLRLRPASSGGFA